MPAFPGQFSWDAGLIWRVGFIAHDKVLDAENLHICSALVDTGADGTCIAESVANALSLSPSGKVTMNTAGDPVDVNVYDVQVAFLLGEHRSPEGGTLSQVQVIAGVRAPMFNPGEREYQALICRDILKHGILTLSFDGHYSFSY